MDPEVLTKYKCAGLILNEALEVVLAECKPKAKIVDICEKGDAFINKQAWGMWKKRTERDVAFPTCITVNNIRHSSPLASDETVLREGDMVNIDMGCHIDWFIALVGHTHVLQEGPVSGRKADVIAAANTAADVALRLVRPGKKNNDVTEAIQKVAAAYECKIVEGVHSHQSKAVPSVSEVEFQMHQVYEIDIVASTGDGEPKLLDEKKTTIYEKPGDFVAQIKFTVLLMPNGSDRITSHTLQELQPTKSTHPEIYRFLASTYNGFEKMMKMNMPEEVPAATTVFWDINKFRVPAYFDPALVRPCIKWFLESHGYFGPVTITAFGELTDITTECLEKLYYSGIGLTHVPAGSLDIGSYIYDFKLTNPPKGNMISISQTDIVDESAYWDCVVCYYDGGPPRQGFENLFNHLHGKEHKELSSEWLSNDIESLFPVAPVITSPVDVTITSMPLCETKVPFEMTVPGKEAVTSVIWDIGKCPVPRGFDPHLVSQCIKKFLGRKGCSGSLTISAVGILTEVNDDILQAVSSSGIVLIHVPNGTKDIPGLIFKFIVNNPPPANVILITDPYCGLFTFMLERKGYSFLIQNLDNCIAVAGEDEKDKCCSGTGEWVCTKCCSGHGFESLTSHLSSGAHQQKMLGVLPWDAW